MLPWAWSGRSPKPYKLGIGRDQHSCTPKTAPKPCLKLMPCLQSSSSEHGLYIGGIGFGWSPIGYEGLISRFKVQGDSLLLCSSILYEKPMISDITQHLVDGCVDNAMGHWTRYTVWLMPKERTERHANEWKGNCRQVMSWWQPLWAAVL